MRLGSIIYFIPFFFVFDPAFIWRGPIEMTLFLFAQAMVGIVFVAGALQGFLVFVGWMSNRPAGLIGRALIGIGGIALAMPGNKIIDVTNGELAIWAAVLILVGVVVALLDRRSAVVEAAN